MTSCTCCDSASEPCAAKISIFKHLDLKSLEEISSIAVHRSVKKGETLFSPNDNKGLYLISEGRVKVYELTPSGREYLLRVLNKGDFVGEDSLFSSEESYTYGEAVSDSLVCYIQRDEFLDLLTRYPSICLKLLEEYSRRMVRSSHQSTSNMSETVFSRLSSYLINLSDVLESDYIEIPLQLKELSSYLSTTPETLSRRLSELEKQNMISRHGRKIRITNKEKLRQLIET